MNAGQLKSFRNELGKTQRELADDMMVSVRRIQNWEQGVNPIPMWVEHHPVISNLKEKSK